MSKRLNLIDKSQASGCWKKRSGEAGQRKAAEVVPFSTLIQIARSARAGTIQHDRLVSVRLQRLVGIQWQPRMKSSQRL